MIEYIATFIACLLAGILTGITGLGGGLIMVPSFLVLAHLGYVDFTIYQIVGISATVVFFNSIITLYYRKNEKFLPAKENIKNIVVIMIGAFLGSYLSYFAPEKLLNIIYLFVAFLSVFFIKKELLYNFDGRVVLKMLLFFFVGFITSCVGVAGATLFAVVLKLFYHKKTKELLPTITLFVAVNAIFSFGGKVYAKDVFYYLVPFIVVASFIGAKIGVLISRKTSSKTIANLMVIATLIGIATVLFDMFGY